MRCISPVNKIKKNKVLNAQNTQHLLQSSDLQYQLLHQQPQNNFSHKDAYSAHHVFLPPLTSNFAPFSNFSILNIQGLYSVLQFYSTDQCKSVL